MLGPRSISLFLFICFSPLLFSDIYIYTCVCLCAVIPLFTLNKHQLDNRANIWCRDRSSSNSIIEEEPVFNPKNSSLTERVESNYLLFDVESFCVSSTRLCQHHLFREHDHYMHYQQFTHSFGLL